MKIRWVLLFCLASNRAAYNFRYVVRQMEIIAHGRANATLPVSLENSPCRQWLALHHQCGHRQTRQEELLTDSD